MNPTAASAHADGARHVGRSLVIPRSGGAFTADVSVSQGLIWCSRCERTVNGLAVPMGDRLLNLREVREIRPERAQVTT
ncbi:hypothetical protein [Conexibacter sp. S30A1]|uniref:hypothetical protein n=1 Tax=Conexibacter sp. S30A1 TaxID=2937800 RepID=UPI00200F8175|nr:hypothetical protein [Conexibacter sp. S30A1]